MVNTSSGTSSSTINKNSSAHTSSSATLSEESRRRLDEMQAKLNARLSKKGPAGSYIKWDSDGCRRIIQFDPNRFEETEVPFPRSTKPVPRVNLWGQEVIDGKAQGTELACITVSPTLAKDIFKMFKLGVTVLDITRHGMGKSDTWYDVQPV